jgi:secreted trypsin-like serine protease
MNGHGAALRRVNAAVVASTVLWVLGASAAAATLTREGPARAAPAAAAQAVARASIVDGAGASIAEYPFQVALYDPRKGPPAKSFFCGGVILDATRVVTAAHCLLGEGGRDSAPAEVAVLAGSTYLQPLDPGSVRDPVAAVTVDPAYDPIASDYDVGVLRLERPLWSGPAPALDGHDTIAPVALGTVGATAPPDAALTVGQGAATAAQGAAGVASAQTAPPPTLAAVSGWGDTTPEPGGAPSYPLGLRAARVPLVGTGLCQEAYAAVEQPITPRMVCAGGTTQEGAGRTDSCYGDSGGPLILPGAAPPAGDVLVGLVDFGNGCAQAGYPGVYVRVADAAVASFLGGGAQAAVAGGVRRGLCPHATGAGHHRGHGPTRPPRRAGRSPGRCRG